MQLAQILDLIRNYSTAAQVTLCAMGVVTLWCLWWKRNSHKISTGTIRNFSSSGGECKMVILIRADINMGKGKAAAQCCHAVLEAYKRSVKNYPSVVEQWEDSGQPKVALKVESEEELNELVKKARQVGLTAESIRDAGRTQLAAGTKTVAAIGPGPAKMIDIITGHLKLY